MDSDNQSRRLQFSLRSFLFVILIVGPIAGVFVPIILDSITEWKPPPRSQPNGPRRIPSPRANDTESYYETGETPLY